MTTINSFELKNEKDVFITSAKCTSSSFSESFEFFEYSKDDPGKITKKDLKELLGINNFINEYFGTDYMTTFITDNSNVIEELKLNFHKIKDDCSMRIFHLKNEDENFYIINLLDETGDPLTQFKEMTNIKVGVCGADCDDITLLEMVTLSKWDDDDEYQEYLEWYVDNRERYFDYNDPSVHYLLDKFCKFIKLKSHHFNSYKFPINK